MTYKYLKEWYVFIVAIFIVTENKVNHKRKLVNQVMELHTVK